LRDDDDMLAALRDIEESLGYPSGIEDEEYVYAMRDRPAEVRARLKALARVAPADGEVRA
jgi:hypothetical protein